MPKRVDANQSSIVEALRKIPGVSAQSTHMVGDGFTDIIVGYKKINYIFELKNPKRPPCRRKLREKQKQFHAEWKGQVDTVMTLYDIIEIIKKNGEKP